MIVGAVMFEKCHDQINPQKRMCKEESPNDVNQ